MVPYYSEADIQFPYRLRLGKLLTTAIGADRGPAVLTVAGVSLSLSMMGPPCSPGRFGRHWVTPDRGTSLLHSSARRWAAGMWRPLLRPRPRAGGESRGDVSRSVE